MSDLGDRLRDRLEELENFAVDLVYGRRRGATARVVGGFLRVLSGVFGMLVGLRVRLYEKRVLRSEYLGCLVVVVGNLTVGGTGKTPVVEIFARNLMARGRKVAILSRGYKSRKEPGLKRLMRAITHREAPPPRVVSDGNAVLLGPQEAGDEPYMLARNLPGVAVVCDRDRVKAGRYAIQKFGVDTLILDDGYQYLRLKGRMNLCLIDTNNPFGNGALLPRGILREPLRHLSRADYVFLTKATQPGHPELEAVVDRYAKGREVITCSHVPKELRTLDGRRGESLHELQGRRLAAFSGIAAPESFERLLTEAGAELVAVSRFLDHHWFTKRDLERVANEALANGADWIVTTEKDAVRLDPRAEMPLPVLYLRLEIAILQGADDFEEAVARICFPAQTEAGAGSAGDLAG